jgi:cytochrome c-type biogenesis protein CcmH/NrfF
MEIRRVVRRVLWVIVLVGAFAGGAACDRLVAPDSPEAMAAEIMSPFCPGRTLASCPSSSANELQAEIAGRLRRGETREAIVADLRTRYGAVIDGAPPAEGVGLMLRVAPFIVGILILWVLSRFARISALPELTPPVADPGRRQQLEDDLADLD